jgi:8-oxo-dGTP pyrophosphatase MutT (NUDIX family)
MAKKDTNKIVICLIYNDRDEILMGCRNDNGKWTTPAGHLMEGEDLHEGVVRELNEETGLQAEKVDLLGMNQRDGLLLYLFKIKVSGEIDTSNDPDEECDNWHYIDPLKVWDRLHVSKKQNLAIKYWALGSIQ